MEKLSYYCGICDEEITHNQIKSWGITSCRSGFWNKAKWMITGNGKTARGRCVAYAHRKYPSG